jgi:hypothetical protein
MTGFTPNSMGAPEEDFGKGHFITEETEQEPEYTSTLQELIPNDRRLFVAMEYFLLASPTRQLSQLGDMDSLKKEGDRAKSAGDKITARINYESAAKVALYEGDREAFESLLKLADNVTSGSDDYAQFHRTLLDHIDEAVRIADEYYEKTAEAHGRKTVAANPSAPS